MAKRNTLSMLAVILFVLLGCVNHRAFASLVPPNFGHETCDERGFLVEQGSKRIMQASKDGLFFNNQNLVMMLDILRCQTASQAICPDIECALTEQDCAVLSGNRSPQPPLLDDNSFWAQQGVSELCYNDSATSGQSRNCGTGYYCNNGACTSKAKTSRILFVTSGVHQGDLGGLAGADAICNAYARQPDAMDVLKTREFYALLNLDDGSSFSIVDKIRNVDPNSQEFNIANPLGEFLATNVSQLISSGPDVTEKWRITEEGTPLDATSYIWNGDLSVTYTFPSVPSNTCNSWASSSGSNSGVYYSASSSSRNWPTGTRSCDNSAHLYCLEVIRYQKTW